MKPNEDRLSWGDYNMLIAKIASLRSPDPNTQVGSYLVSQDNRPLGIGYNGAPRGIDVYSMPWDREGNPEETKYGYVVHSEVNTLFNCSGSTKGSRLYTTLFPCNECTKLLIQAEISEIVYLDNLYKDTWQHRVATRMLDLVSIKYRQHIFSDNAKEALQSLL